MLNPIIVYLVIAYAKKAGVDVAFLFSILYAQRRRDKWGSREYLFSL